MALREELSPGDAAHIADHEVIAARLNLLEGQLKALGVTANLVARHAVSPGGANTNSVIGNGADSRLCLAPVPIFQTGQYDRLTVSCQSAAGTGGKIRFGLYASGADGMPTALLADSGQIDATSTGTKMYTVPSPLTLTAGLYWAGGCVQGNASPRGNFQVINLNANPYETLFTGVDPNVQIVRSMVHFSVPGAFPDPWTGGFGAGAELSPAVAIMQVGSS